MAGVVFMRVNSNAPTQVRLPPTRLCSFALNRRTVSHDVFRSERIS
jgi:hypothetical protein